MKAGVVMIVYLFVVIIAYFILSTPVTMLFDAFDDNDMGAATEQFDVFMPTIRTCFNMFFALMAAIAPTWFIFWVMHREPDWRYYQ